MTVRNIAIFSATTKMPTTQLSAIVKALQIQVDEHFGPSWNVAAKLNLFGPGESLPPNQWWLGCFDHSDQAGALGYHDLTNTGLPFGKAFVGTDLEVGALPSVTLSHELLEMLGDPFIGLSYEFANKIWYAYEACDPVEADQDGYKIGDVMVSDFVTPEYFIRGLPLGTSYDHRGLLKHAGEIRPRGYQSVWTPTYGWTQISGHSNQQALHLAHLPAEAGYTESYLDLPRLGSRRERRYRNSPMIQSHEHAARRG